MLLALDMVLVVGATLRLTRLVTTDHLGHWWIQQPAEHRSADPGWRGTLWGYLHTMVGCPFCIGYWLGVVVLVSLAACHGPGADTLEAWRWVTGTLTLNYVTAHIGARLDGDTE